MSKIKHLSIYFALPYINICITSIQAAIHTNPPIAAVTPAPNNWIYYRILIKTRIL